MLTPLEQMLSNALALLVADVKQYEAWARPCYALEVAELALTTAEAIDRETAHSCALDPVAIATAEAGYMRHSDLVDMAVEADVPLGLR